MKTPWTTKKLGEIKKDIKLDKVFTGTIPYIEIGSIDVNSKKVVYGNKGAVKGSVFCPENSILISRVRPTRGAVVFIDKKIAVSSAFTIIKPKPEINPKLLFYFLAWNNKFFNYLGSKQKGTNYPSVRQSDILDFQISYPENRKIQQKIVEILDAIQEGVKTQEKIIEKTKELKKAMMQDLFKYGGPSFRKGRKLKKTEIGKIPEDWEVTAIEDIGEVVTGTTPSTKIENYWNGNIPFVTPVDMEEKYIKNTKRYISETGLKKARLLPIRSILVVCIASLGKISIASVPCISNQQINAIICKKNVDNEYIYYAMHYKDNILKMWASRTTSPIIKKSTFEKFLLPLPNIEEQCEIAEILQTIDEKIEVEEKKKTLYEELFKTMLNKLMNKEKK